MAEDDGMSEGEERMDGRKDGWNQGKVREGFKGAKEGVHARVRKQEVRRRGKGSRDGRRTPGRGCRQTGRVTRGRR